MNSMISSLRFFALAVLPGVMDLCFFGGPHAQEGPSGTPVMAQDDQPLAEARAIAKEA